MAFGLSSPSALRVVDRAIFVTAVQLHLLRLMGGVTTASTVMETPVTLASIAVVLLRLLDIS